MGFRCCTSGDRAQLSEGTLTCVRVQSAWARIGGRARGCSPEEGSAFDGGCGEETAL